MQTPGYNVHTFEVRCLPCGTPSGKVVFMAETPEEALDAALHTARLFNLDASIGPTGRVVYPHGPGGGTAWVLAARKVRRAVSAAQTA